MRKSIAFLTILCAFPLVVNAQTAPRGNVAPAQVNRATPASGQRAQVPAAQQQTRAAAPAVSARSAVRQTTVAPVMAPARSATAPRGTDAATPAARSGTTPAQAPAAVRAATTPVFNDLSKLDAGYTSCRDAYSACMDQFCAVKSDQFRRCICSDKFREIQSTDSMLETAISMLQDFADSSLDVVGMTAREVTAMRSATEGEDANTADTTKAASTLDRIRNFSRSIPTDVSGGMPAASPINDTAITSMLRQANSWDAPDTIDRWRISDNSRGPSVADLEGNALYNEISGQCGALVRTACETDAAMQMARASYSMMIQQDCNAAERRTDDKRFALDGKVRDAQRLLWTARLDEYQNRNSASVNECIAKVSADILQPNACGEDWIECLDPTGRYIDGTTGDPILSPQFFKLADLMNINATDIVRGNPDFAAVINGKKIHAEASLRSCTDNADYVWDAFLRRGLIQIAQAQDSIIEDVKNSCVSTIAKCYDRQSGAFADMDTTTAQATLALGAMTAQHMCRDEVMACAALWAGPGEQCNVDAKGKISNPDSCGMAALLRFVDAVDDVKIAEGCRTGLENHVQELCKDSTGFGFPYGCRSWSISHIKGLLDSFAKDFCADSNGRIPWGIATTQITTASGLFNDSSVIGGLLREITVGMVGPLMEICAETDGAWRGPDQTLEADVDFYGPWQQRIFGGRNPPHSGFGGMPTSDWGFCIKNTPKIECETADMTAGSKGYAKWNTSADRCDLSIEWYKEICKNLLEGFWDTKTQQCFIAN
ncbi:MAG: hypothetical protein FWG39_03310 [Alphaproteobacteria bacterium]|nr:hypothetical protein [Alphaproteobacteria bacterium]